MIAAPNCPHTMKGWFIPGKSPIAACDVHRKIWVDDATGLRLESPPENPATAHAEVCEFWSSDLEKLFRAAGVPRAGTPGLKGSALGKWAATMANGRGPCIVSPKQGLIYHVRVGTADDEMLNLEATAETSGDHLHWFVDAAYVGASNPSCALLWKAQPGKHVVRAVDDAGRVDTREIMVTSVE